MKDKYKYYNVKMTQAARINRNNPTPEESKLWEEILRTRQMMGYKFLRQKPIGHYIVDFYCSKLQLVIEVDGSSHKEKEEYDKYRTEELHHLGLKVIRYYNREIISNIDKVRDSIEKEIQKRELELTNLFGSEN